MSMSQLLSVFFLNKLQLKYSFNFHTFYMIRLGNIYQLLLFLFIYMYCFSYQSCCWSHWTSCNLNKYNKYNET